MYFQSFSRSMAIQTLRWYVFSGVLEPRMLIFVGLLFQPVSFMSNSSKLDHKLMYSTRIDSGTSTKSCQISSSRKYNAPSATSCNFECVHSAALPAYAVHRNAVLSFAPIKISVVHNAVGPTGFGLRKHVAISGPLGTPHACALDGNVINLVPYTVLQWIQVRFQKDYLHILN